MGSRKSNETMRTLVCHAISHNVPYNSRLDTQQPIEEHHQDPDPPFTKVEDDRNTNQQKRDEKEKEAPHTACTTPTHGGENSSPIGVRDTSVLPPNVYDSLDSITERCRRVSFTPQKTCSPTSNLKFWVW